MKIVEKIRFCANILVFCFVSFAKSQAFIGTSLAECQRFAAKFANTCDLSQGKPANVASITGEQVQCVKTGDFCVDAGQRDA